MKKLKHSIERAEKNHIAIGHFNVSNFEQLSAIARVGIQLQVPIIIGVSEGEREYLGLHRIRDLIASYNVEHGKEGGFQLFLNADHTHATDKIRDAARVGFHAVLFDGGSLPLEENIAQTRVAVRLARAASADVLVEGELGYIGSGSQLLDEIPEGVATSGEYFTKPEDAEKFVKETGVDLLGPAVGNIHGMLKNAKNPRLDIERIRAIRLAAGVPLVLHGGSGVSNEDFLAAIDAGISIIHISTELRVAWREGLEKSLQTHLHEVAPYKVMSEVIESIEKVVTERLKLFNKL